MHNVPGVSVLAGTAVGVPSLALPAGALRTEASPLGPRVAVGQRFHRAAPLRCPTRALAAMRIDGHGSGHRSAQPRSDTFGIAYRFDEFPNAAAGVLVWTRLRLGVPTFKRSRSFVSVIVPVEQHLKGIRTQHLLTPQ